VKGLVDYQCVYILPSSEESYHLTNQGDECTNFYGKERHSLLWADLRNSLGKVRVLPNRVEYFVIFMVCT
jgi:hypothetical protein